MPAWKVIDPELTPKQWSIVYGTLLGDGCLSKVYEGRRYCRLQLAHGIKQKDYLEWKVQELTPLFKVPVKYQTSLSRGVYISVQTKSMPMMVDLRNMFYSNGVKTVTRQILSLLDWQSIAVWFADDGCTMGNKGKRRALALALGNQTEQEHSLISDHFDMHGFKTTLHNVGPKVKLLYFWGTSINQIGSIDTPFDPCLYAL